MKRTVKFYRLELCFFKITSKFVDFFSLESYLANVSTVLWKQTRIESEKEAVEMTTNAIKKPEMNESLENLWKIQKLKFLCLKIFYLSIN